MKKLIISTIVWIMLLWQMTFADYEPNVEDEVKLYNITRDLLLRLEKNDNKESIINKMQEKIVDLSWKSENELKNYDKNESFNNFREYILKYLYRNIQRDINDYYFDEPGKIIENSFAKAFVNSSNIYMTEKEIYLEYKNWWTWKMVEFFKTDEDIEEFLNNTVLEEKYHGKCKAIKRAEKWANFTQNQVYTIWWFGDYKSTTRDSSDCGEYWEWNSIKYFEVRGDYIWYINAGQDFNGLHFKFIDMK